MYRISEFGRLRQEYCQFENSLGVTWLSPRKRKEEGEVEGRERGREAGEGSQFVLEHFCGVLCWFVFSSALNDAGLLTDVCELMMVTL